MKHVAITAQIEAVQLAELKAEAIGKAAKMSLSEIDELRRRLEAAVETLKTLEYGSAIAR